jgi:hypothetical protein
MRNVLSSTYPHNELMRRCLLRWQSERRSAVFRAHWSIVIAFSFNLRILLANLLQRSRSTFSCVSFPSFFAFKEGMWDTQIWHL